MQTAANLSQSALAASPSRANVETLPSAPLNSTATRTLWVRMAEIYGHRWASAYGEASDLDGAAGTWAKGLAGIAPAQVAVGLGACIASADPWPPTLPEFRARCLGIPTLAFVRDDATRATQYRAPFTVLTWQFLDGYRYRQASSDQADRLLREAYEQAREHVMRGGALPEPAVGGIAQEKREVKPAAPEVAARHLEEIARNLGIDRKTQAAGGDA